MDIVERLRDWGKFGVSRGDFVAYSHEAADEIERLEGELRSLRAENYTLNAHLGVYKSWHGHWPRLTREELDEAIAKLPEGRS